MPSFLVPPTRRDYFCCSHHTLTGKVLGRSLFKEALVFVGIHWAHGEVPDTYPDKPWIHGFFFALWPQVALPSFLPHLSRPQ